MAGNLKLLAGLATGYVLGARAGRERYERIAEATRGLAERPEVRELTGKVWSGLGAGLEKATGTASDRLQQLRGEEGGPEGQPRAEAGGTRSQPPEAGPLEGKGRDVGGSSPEPSPSSKGRRERSRSGH
jgi:hypothetical protein